MPCHNLDGYTVVLMGASSERWRNKPAAMD